MDSVYLPLIQKRKNWLLHKRKVFKGNCLQYRRLCISEEAELLEIRKKKERHIGVGWGKCICGLK